MEVLVAEEIGKLIHSILLDEYPDGGIKELHPNESNPLEIQHNRLAAREGWLDDRQKFLTSLRGCRMNPVDIAHLHAHGCSPSSQTPLAFYSIPRPDSLL